MPNKIIRNVVVGVRKNRYTTGVRPLNKSFLPQKKELLRMIESYGGKLYSNHKWGTPEPHFDYARDLRENNWGIVFQVPFSLTCVECGSVKRIQAVFWKEDFTYGKRIPAHWELQGYSSYIRHPENYHQTKCYKRYRGKHSYYGRKNPEPLPDDLITCPCCSNVDERVVHTRIEVAKCVLAHKIQRETQINKNMALITKLVESGKWNRKTRRRFYYIVYRLYRYYDIPPEAIADHSFTAVETIRRGIGRIFKEQCLKDKKCVFRKELGG